MSEPTPISPLSGKRSLTYQDLLDTPDDGKRYEILDGELAVTASPILQHQRVSSRLQRLLEDWLAPRDDRAEVFQAPADVLLDVHTVVVPDLVLVRGDNTAVIRTKNIQGSPDLIVEIASPSTSRRDRSVKAGLYARFGVPHYWIADPETMSLETFQLEGGSYRSSAAASAPEIIEVPGFPELRLDLARVFVLP